MFTPSEYQSAKVAVLSEITQALDSIDPAQIDAFLQLVCASEKVFFVGVGRVLLSLQAIAKRYTHLGIKANVVGDICEPAITSRDLLIVGSGSGETLFPAAIAHKAHQLGAKVVHIGSNPQSGIAPIADLFVRIPAASRFELPDEVKSTQPMTSLFEQGLLLFGDITAKMLMDQKNIDLDKLWEYHANLE